MHFSPFLSEDSEKLRGNENRHIWFGDRSSNGFIMNVTNNSIPHLDRSTLHIGRMAAKIAQYDGIGLRQTLSSVPAMSILL